MRRLATLYFFFFFNDTATTEIYTLSLHDALPILGELRQFSSATCDICDEAVARMLATFTDRKSTRLNSSHLVISYAVFCLKKKKTPTATATPQHSAPTSTPPATIHTPSSNLPAAT